MYRFSDKTIETIKADVKRFMSDREKDDNYFKFINWRKKDNEFAVLTMYAYEDIQLPKKFDILFQIDRPNNFIHQDFAITQAVFNGWTPLSQISKGHKHICIVEFYNDIPDIVNSIPFFGKKETLKNGFQLGFCDRNDFESIKTNLLQT